MIHLTFDQDWAPAWATERLMEQVVQAGLEATFFVTHDCPSLVSLRQSGAFELGWHPNFLPGSSHGEGIEAVLDHMAAIVPEARGARAHTLMRGTPILQAYKARGLRYDAADLHDGISGLEVFKSWTGLARIPIFFEDDVHLERGLSCTLSALDLDSEGVKVFTFHPVLLALNVADLSAYQQLKADLNTRSIPLTEATQAHLAPHRQDTQPGVEDLFQELLVWLRGQARLQGGRLADHAP